MLLWRHFPASFVSVVCLLSCMKKSKSLSCLWLPLKLVLIGSQSCVLFWWSKHHTSNYVGLDPSVVHGVLLPDWNLSKGAPAYLVVQIPGMNSSITCSALSFGSLLAPLWELVNLPFTSSQEFVFQNPPLTSLNCWPSPMPYTMSVSMNQHAWRAMECLGHVRLYSMRLLRHVITACILFETNSWPGVQFISARLFHEKYICTNTHTYMYKYLKDT